jgi:hypothetical protein
VEIERQRWYPVSEDCVQTFGAFGWTELIALQPPFPNLTTVVFRHVVHPVGVPEAGCYLLQSCTQYANYPEAWAFASAETNAKLVASVNDAFGGKGGRVIDVDIRRLGFGSAGGVQEHGLRLVIVPNYGPAARAWWWSGTTGATADELADIINGKAWPAGNWKQDGIKKKLVSLARGKDGKFRFVLNEWKPGETWWWGYGASLDNIAAVLNGQAWATFKADKIEKRLVSLKRHGKGNWTFLMVPREGLDWWWWPDKSMKDLAAFAEANNARIIDLDEWNYPHMTFSAVLVQNT